MVCRRGATQVRWRANFNNNWLGPDPAQYAARMIGECVRARRYVKADVFSHCQPQSNYLYRHEVATAGGQGGEVSPPPLFFFQK